MRGALHRAVGATRPARRARGRARWWRSRRLRHRGAYAASAEPVPGARVARGVSVSRTLVEVLASPAAAAAGAARCRSSMRTGRSLYAEHERKHRRKPRSRAGLTGRQLIPSIPRYEVGEAQGESRHAATGGAGRWPGPRIRGDFQARKQRSAGAFELPEGTVYPALHRLESAGLLASTWEIVAGRRRRMYRLTAGGPGGADGRRRGEWRVLQRLGRARSGRLTCHSPLGR